MNSTGSKKTLLIFFGEFRTFSVIPQQLYHLDKVDVLISTWENSYVTKKNVPSQKINLVKELIPHAKLLLVKDTWGDDKTHNFRMWYHWMNALNSIENEDEYDKVLLHRCDMISDWHVILEQVWESDKLYISSAGTKENDKLWINDYYLGGTFKLLKKFVNLFDGNNEQRSHFPIGNVLLKNNIIWEELSIQTLLVRPCAEDLFDSLNKNNIVFFEQSGSSKTHKKYIEIHNSNFPNHQIDPKTWTENFVFRK